MRAKLNPRLLLGRLYLPGRSKGDSHNGMFSIIGPLRRRLIVLVSNGYAWEHASIHIELFPTEPPTWGEMNYVKELVWDDSEIVIQYHPPKSQYVNVHPGTLHLWRPIGIEIPLPPIELV